MSEYPLNAQEEEFSLVTVFDTPMLFTGCRVNRKTVPKGLHFYEVRHDSEDWGEPIQIAKGIMVNHFGTLLSSKPIRLEPNELMSNAYRDIDAEKDWVYEDVVMTTNEYMERYPPKRERSYER